MKRFWPIFAGAALVLWLSLSHSLGRRAPAAPRAASEHAAAAPAATAAPAIAVAAQPAVATVGGPAGPAAQAQAVPSASGTAAASAYPSIAASELIMLPPAHDRPRYTPAQARAGSPGKILGHAFAMQKPDPEWSPGAEADIRKALGAAQLVPGDVFAVECRSSVCKLQVHYSLRERDHFDAAWSGLRKHFGNDIGFDPIGTMDPHGRQTLRVYVTREGKTLRDYPP